MSNNTESVLNSFKTIVEMFEARDKHDIATELRKIGTPEIEVILKNRNMFTLDVEGKLRIIYCLEPKMKAPDIKRMIEDSNYDNYIIVIREKISANNTKSFQEVNKPIQIFEIRELQFNISTHALVPKHRLIEANNDTINAIFQRLGIKSRSQLPVILRNDPMAKFLNAKTGDLIEITRYSPTSGEHVFYRICV